MLQTPAATGMGDVPVINPCGLSCARFIGTASSDKRAMKLTDQAHLVRALAAEQTDSPIERNGKRVLQQTVSLLDHCELRIEATAAKGATFVRVLTRDFRLARELRPQVTANVAAVLTARGYVCKASEIGAVTLLTIDFA